MVADGTQWYQMVLNDTKWYLIVQNGTQWSPMVTNGNQWYQIVPNCTKMYLMVLNGTIHLMFFSCGATLYTALSVCLCVPPKFLSQIQIDIAQRRETSYDVARLLLMVPLEPWQNSTPVFGAAAFCTTNIDDFRASLTLPLRLLMWPRSKVSDVTRRLH